MADIHWTMTKSVYEEYCTTLQSLADAVDLDDFSAIDQLTHHLRSLPGYPHHAHPEHDRIVPYVPGLRRIHITEGGAEDLQAIAVRALIHDEPN